MKWNARFSSPMTCRRLLGRRIESWRWGEGSKVIVSLQHKQFLRPFLLAMFEALVPGEAT